MSGLPPIEVNAPPDEHTRAYVYIFRQFLGAIVVIIWMVVEIRDFQKIVNVPVWFDVLGASVLAYLLGVNLADLMPKDWSWSRARGRKPAPDGGGASGSRGTGKGEETGDERAGAPHAGDAPGAVGAADGRAPPRADGPQPARDERGKRRWWRRARA